MPLKLKKGERLVVTDGAYKGYKGWYNDHPDNKLVQSHKAHVILEVPDGNGLTVCKLIHRNKTRLENAPLPRNLPRESSMSTMTSSKNGGLPFGPPLNVDSWISTQR